MHTQKIDMQFSPRQCTSPRELQVMQRPTWSSVQSCLYPLPTSFAFRFSRAENWPALPQTTGGCERGKMQPETKIDILTATFGISARPTCLFGETCSPSPWCILVEYAESTARGWKSNHCWRILTANFRRPRASVEKKVWDGNQIYQNHKFLSWWDSGSWLSL